MAFYKKKIKYSEIFEITDVRPESKKDLSKFTLANDTIIVGYYKFVDDGKKKVKKYVEISPRDMDLFLIKMGGKFSNARELAKKLEEERKRKNAEHYEKKSKADKLRQEKEEKNKPVDVVVNPKKKTDNVKTVKSDDEK